jgi:RNA-directed DNA polymerase
VVVSFDNVSHEWLVKFIEHRVADRRIIRLIQKWLKAGVSEEGDWTETKVGTPQGAVASPLLANIYLHYVFDLWVNQWRRKTAQGDMIVVRYADDAVLGFEQRSEAEAFLEELRERMQKFGLELHPEKTRLIEFGRYAEEDRKRRGEGKPETFDFLGFTHSCGKTRKGNWFTIRRQTAKKRLRSKLQAVKQELRKRWHKRVSENGKWLRSVVQGYLNYHAVPGNFAADVQAGSGSDVVEGASPSQPAPSISVGTFAADRGALPTLTANSASITGGALRRQIPEVGAVCAKVRPYGSVRGASGNGRPYRD